jgi:restriction system protein
MARRHKNTPAEDFFEELVGLASVLPWWATLPTAVLLFVLVPFDFTATGLTEPSDAAMFVVGIFFKGLFKYMVPLALVIGAVINVLLKFKSITLFSNISKRGAMEVVSKLSWQDFEFLMSEYFKKQGYATEITGGGGADGGIDIKLYKDGQTYLVQCKHYKSWKVSVQIVREFFGIVTAENATGGYIVTSGRFTKDAYSFAEGKNIHLINGYDLVEMLDSNDLEKAKSITNDGKVCPDCGGELLERSGKFGKFLGCSNYPKCKFTKDLK